MGDQCGGKLHQIKDYLIMTRITIAIYTRVSTSGQDASRQQADLEQVARAKGWQIEEVFSDVASGVDQARPGLDAMLEVVKGGKIQKILVTEVSRLGRKTSEILSVVEELTRCNVSLYLAGYQLETMASDGSANPVSQLLLTFLAEFARLEREQLVERIRSGQAEAKRKGKHIGRPVGTSERSEEILAKYPKAAKLIRAGHSIRNVASIAGISPNTAQRVKHAISSS